jgi:hypothetical protein
MMIIRADGRGEIAFGAMQASLKLEYSRSTVFFTWAGFERHGRGQRLRIGRTARRRHLGFEFAYHPGDEAVLKAERVTSSKLLGSQP